MTWYELTLRRYDTNPATGAQDVGRTMSHVESDDGGVIASVLRAAADRLDPPQPVRPAYRRGDLRDAIEATARRPRATLADETDPVVVSTTGDRMDAPEAVLHPAAAEVVARVKADQARGRINPNV